MSNVECEFSSLTFKINLTNYNHMVLRTYFVEVAVIQQIQGKYPVQKSLSGDVSQNMSQNSVNFQDTKTLSFLKLQGFIIKMFLKEMGHSLTS